jgi:hypothetical protein
MEKNKLNEGKESLERIKLLMSYRNDMTLTENENIIKEQNQPVTAENKIKDLLTSCVANKESYSNYSNINHKALAKILSDAILGAGTNENVIEGVMLQINDISDLCLIASYYSNDYGESLFEALKSDLSDEDLSKYVHTPLNKAIQNTLKRFDENDLNSFKEFIAKTYPEAKVSDKEITINGNIYTIKKNDNEWDFKFENDTFTHQQ